MNIIISNSDSRPIYEQIAAQIKGMIIGGELQSGELLPSMRMLARNLRISVITTKRAYEELERDGYIYTQTGRGSFVAERNSQFMREEQLRITEHYLHKAIESARIGGVTQEEFMEIVTTLFGEDS